MSQRTFTSVELQTLLGRADEVTSVAEESRGAAEWLAGWTKSPCTGDLNSSYLRDYDTGEWICFITPWALTWPDGFYAVEEANSDPGLALALKTFSLYVEPVPELRRKAKRAAPGFFGRLFGGGRVDAARLAAAELERVLGEIDANGALVRAREALDRLGAATELQRREGMHLFPGSHGTPDHYLQATRKALKGALNGHFGTSGSVGIKPFEPGPVAAVLERAREARDDPFSEETLRGKAEEIIAERGRDDAARLLDTLPLDKLREVTADRLRISGLPEAGVTTVGDVHRAVVGQLRQIPGIGERSADRLKAAAETLFSEAAAEPRRDIGTERTRYAERLIKVLAAFDALPDLDEEQHARRKRLFEIADLSRNWNVAAGDLDRWAVAFSGGEHSNELYARFRGDIEWAQANPQVLGSYRGLDVVRNPWMDYRRRPAHYQGLLADLLGNQKTGGDDLDADTLAAIRALRLDRTFLNPDLRLRGYQSFGARFAVVQKKTVLGDEMGLGKTVQAIAAAAHVAAVDGVARTRVLVVCPASVVVNWEREIKNFTTGLPVFRAHGAVKEDLVDAWRSEGGFCVVTYDGARTMASRLGAPEFVVVDEAHMIKNPEAQRSRAVARLVDSAAHALLMTGTPLENAVEDFEHLVGYIAPELDVEDLSAREFRRRVAPVYLRRNQDDVLDELPQKTETIDWIDLNDQDRRHYLEAVREGGWMAMRRAPMMTPVGVPAKLERLREIVDEAAEAGRKVLIFSFFLDVLARLEKELGETVVGTVDGSVAAAKRQDLVDQFAAVNGPAVLLAQITAAGAGLNIQAASVVILVEPQVKPSIEAQAIARAHRMGQTSTVLVHRLVADDTADERLLEILGQKTKVFDAYARESESARVHDAVDVSESQLAEEIIAAERERWNVGGESGGDAGVGSAGDTGAGVARRSGKEQAGGEG